MMVIAGSVLLGLVIIGALVTSKSTTVSEIFTSVADMGTDTTKPEPDYVPLLERTVFSVHFFPHLLERWGRGVAKFRAPILIGLLLLYWNLAAFGVSRIEVASPSPRQWSPETSDYSKQLKWVDTYYDQAKRSDGFIMMRRKDGSNMLADPVHHLSMMEKLMRRVVNETVIEAKGLSFGWRDFCLTLEHPVVRRVRSSDRGCACSHARNR